MKKIVLVKIILIAFSTQIKASSLVDNGFYEEKYIKTKDLGIRKVQIYFSKNEMIDNDTKFIIMQDGQMLFDSTKTWNNQEWKIDESLNDLNEYFNYNIVIIGVNSANTSGVGFFDNTKRYAEYFPKQSLDYFNNNIKTWIYKIFIDRKKYDYLSFLVEELIPFLEQEFSTKLNRNNLGIMGSSMGGLLSINAIIEHPKIFGFAGSFSTHWIGIRPIDYILLPFKKDISGDENVIDGITKYLFKNISKIDNHRIYLDLGTKGLDKHYIKIQENIDNLFTDKPFKYMSLKFEGHSHQEKYWALRFKKSLLFLLD